MKFSRLSVLTLLALALGACGGKDDGEATQASADAAPEEITVSDADLAGNPFLEDWETTTTCRRSRRACSSCVLKSRTS